MSHSTMILSRAVSRLLSGAVLATSALFASTALAAVPGITGGSTTSPMFHLTASDGYNSQPDGANVYSWGYGCTSTPAGFLPSATGAAPSAVCPLMQRPGPTMIVTEGDFVTVKLTNALPPAAGKTSIVFPGFQVKNPTTDPGTPGLLAHEAANGNTGNTVTYTFTASKPGTYSYHSGTQPDLQVEMGLSGAIVVLPNTASAATAHCPKRNPTQGTSYSNAASAYGHPETCYDREYLFQFSEMSSTVHEQVKAQVDACSRAPCPPLVATIEPSRLNYFLINGRSMPDIMDTSYSAAYVNQPYNGNPHMHPGERVLMRVIGQGRLQHPFHFHGNHARVLARDANMLVSQSDPKKLGGPLLFTIATVSGQTVDAIFTWTGQGLNWDVYGLQNSIPVANAAAVRHTCKGKDAVALAR